MVSPAQLRRVLSTVQRDLETKHPGFKIQYTSLGYYFSAITTLYALSNDTLFITVKIPITKTSSQFDLYSVYSLPIPSNSTTSNSTKITGLPMYFGISRDQQYYAEFFHDFHAGCQGDVVKRCAGITSLKSRASPSCVSSIFFDLPDAAMKLCNIRYEPDSLFEGAIEIINRVFEKLIEYSVFSYLLAIVYHKNIHKNLVFARS